MMLLNVGDPTSAIQLIVYVIPIDTIDGSDGGRLVGSGTQGAVNLHGGADLVGRASRALIDL
jgi:hypothetical protein